MKSSELELARKAAGARERYALEHGNRTPIMVRGHICWRFTYSIYDPYQDANGALYDTVIHQWVN